MGRSAGGIVDVVSETRSHSRDTGDFGAIHHRGHGGHEGPERCRGGRVRPQKSLNCSIAADAAAATEEFNYMELTGGCLCGGTRYELKGEPFSLGDCHCIDCRRSAGAPVVTWGSVYRKDLRLTRGEPRKIQHAGRIRSFAACCGTHLFFEETNDSETVDVTIASLDDPAPFAPQKVIWLEDKLPWVKLDETLPHFQKGS